MAIQQNLQTIIDHHFFVPVGAVDIRQENADDSSTIYTGNDTADDNNQPVLAAPTSTVPMPPASFTVVSQRVRISSGGVAVVDVTMEFPDIQGIDHIDVRVTKA